MNDTQPGQLIVPHSSEDPKPPTPGVPEPDRPAEAPESAPAPNPLPEPAYPPQPAAPLAAPVALSTVEPIAPMQPSVEAPQPSPAYQAAVGDPNAISWTAAEFVEHQKSPGWFAALAGSAVVIAALAYLISRDNITTGVIVLTMLGFGLFAARRPHTLSYSISAFGLQIGQKQYAFHEFKAFSVTEEAATISIVFMPLKRFMPPLVIYLVPDIETKVVEVLSVFLPYEPHRADAVENLMRRIHF